VIQSSTASADINHHWKSVEEVTDCYMTDNIGNDLVEPPRLHSTTAEGNFLPAAPTKVTISSNLHLRNIEAIIKNRMKVMVWNSLSECHWGHSHPFRSYMKR
jgi:hypothetical protein